MSLDDEIDELAREIERTIQENEEKLDELPIFKSRHIYQDGPVLDLPNNHG